MEITFRTMEVADLPQARKLWTAEPFLGVTESDSPSRLEAYLHANEGMSFVACDGGKLVGTILAGHDERRSFINHLCVDSSYRHLGIGSQLVAICESALRDELPLRSYVMVYRDNANAVKFWANRGYRLDEDLVVMKKGLSG